MEITNKTKVKIFAPYIGCLTYDDLGRFGGIRRERLMEIHADGCLMIWDEPLQTLENRPSCKLILKPLSEITDEDAKEAIKIWGEAPYPFGAITEDSRPSKWRRVIIEHSKELPIFVYQYLQSKGYDLPNYLLGGKTFFECELAIYE